MWRAVIHWPNTPHRRCMLLAVIILLFLVATALTRGTVWQRRLIALFPSAILIVLLRRLWYEWRATRGRRLRWQMRVLKSWRALSAISPGLKLLHSLAIALALLWVIVVIDDMPEVARWLMWGTFVVLAFAGTCEVVALTARVVRNTWAQTMGKILAVTLGVALAAISLALAKQVTHNLAHIDPKYLTEFTAVVTCGMFLPVYLALASGVLAAYAIVQLAMMYLAIGSSLVFTPFKPFLGLGFQERLRVLAYRIRNGKRPPGRITPPKLLLQDSEIFMIASPLSKLALYMVLTGALDALAGVLPVAAPLMENSLVALEYRPNSRCTNLKTGDFVAYMDDHWVSVARKRTGGYDFVVARCEFNDASAL